MMDRIDREGQTYLRQAERLLVCNAARREEFRGQTAKTIDLYFEENPKHSFGDFVRDFGPPERAAQEFMDCLDPEEVGRAQNARKQKRRLLVALACIVLAAAIGVAVYALQTRAGEYHVVQRTVIYAEESGSDDVADVPDERASST